MVTAKASEAEEIASLEAGADDHLAKPFDEAVLIARLRCLTRRREREFSREQADRFPGLSLDLEAGRLRIDDKPVHLTPKEMDLLAIFLQRPDMIHSRSYLWRRAIRSSFAPHLLGILLQCLKPQPIPCGKFCQHR